MQNKNKSLNWKRRTPLPSSGWVTDGQLWTQGCDDGRQQPPHTDQDLRLTGGRPEHQLDHARQGGFHEVPEHRPARVRYEGEGVGGPALDHGAGVVLDQGQEDAQTGSEVLGRPQAADVLVQAAQGEAVTSSTSRAVFRKSKLCWAISAVNLLSDTTFII